MNVPQRKTKRTSPKEFEHTHQVCTYVYIYIYSMCICVPFLGCDVWKHPPPSQKKGGRQPSSPKQNSEVLKPSKSITFSICFVDVDSTWDTSVPEVVGNFPPWFNIHSTNVPGSRFHLLFLNVFLKLNYYTKSWLCMRGSYFFVHPEFEKQRTNSKPPWFKHDWVEISWCMFQIRNPRALKIGRCPLLGIIFLTLILTYTTIFIPR